MDININDLPYIRMKVNGDAPKQTGHPTRARFRMFMETKREHDVVVANSH